MILPPMQFSGARERLIYIVLVVLALMGLRCASEAEDRMREVTSGSLPVLSALPDFSLLTSHGEPAGSGVLRGKVWIATVIMTRSQGNTLQQMRMMGQIQQMLQAQAFRHSVRLVTLTAEPENDTPEVLKSYSQRAGADSSNWRFLTGAREDVIAIVDAMGLPIREGAFESESPITLSPKFVLVDRGMRVRGLYDVRRTEQLQALLRDVSFILPEAPELNDGTGRMHLVIPPENLDLPWLESRRKSQLAASSSIGVFHDFTFRDKRRESGITFRNKVVDNAGKHWMPNHYDHGNGIAVADVDGDDLLDLYFTSQVGGNALWRNTGGGRFEDITRKAGVDLADRVNVAASFADIDNDGDPDLYVTSVNGGNALFRNDGNGAFTDISQKSGTDYRGHSSAAVFFDYDRDGLLDLFVLNVGEYTSTHLLPVTNGTSKEQSDGHAKFYQGREDAFIAHLEPDRSERSILYRNRGGELFEDVTDKLGLVNESWSGDATPMDANVDGWPDLYVLNMQGDDEYYENVRGKRFVRRGREFFPRTPWGSMGVKVFDYNNDGRLDLYLTDMHSDMSRHVPPQEEKHKAHMQWPDSLLATDGRSIFGNALFRSEGAGAYREVSKLAGAENYWPWGPSVGDLNADGYIDVFIASSMNYPFTYGINSVLLNDRGRRFVDAEYILGVEPRKQGKMLTPWYTLACDDEDRQHDYCQGRQGSAVVWGSVGSRSAAVFDLEGDGDLDIVTNDFNSEPLVLVSDLSERKRDLNYIVVRLVGTESNRDGLGATVTVQAGGRRYVKAMDGMTGYLSHGVTPLYFGLGEAAQADRVEVRWPSGKTHTVPGPIESGRTLVLPEE